MYHFRTTKTFTDEQLLALYNDVGWFAYTQNVSSLKKGMAQSLAVISVWQKNTLVGLIRAVSDGQTILYIQDLLVSPAHQNHRLGSQLLKKLLADYPHVRQKVLLTEEARDVRYFYEKHGFQSCDQGQAVAFAILN